MNFSGESGISLIIFQKNAGVDTENTLRAVEEAIANFPKYSYEIIFVDDGSYVFHPPQIRSELVSESKVVVNSTSLGISGAIHTGAMSASKTRMIPIPGSNMYSSEAISNLIELEPFGDLILGCRNNLSDTRPVLKRLASKILRDLTRTVTFPYVGDVHGIGLYWTEDVRKFMPPKGKHGGDLCLITRILVNQGKLIQTLAPIQPQHNKRESKVISDNWPSFAATFSAIIGLIKAAFLYRKSRFSLKRHN